MRIERRNVRRKEETYDNSCLFYIKPTYIYITKLFCLWNPTHIRGHCHDKWKQSFRVSRIDWSLHPVDTIFCDSGRLISMDEPIDLLSIPMTCDIKYCQCKEHSSSRRIIKFKLNPLVISLRYINCSSEYYGWKILNFSKKTDISRLEALQKHDNVEGLRLSIALDWTLNPWRSLGLLALMRNLNRRTRIVETSHCHSSLKHRSASSNLHANVSIKTRLIDIATPLHSLDI